MIDTGIYTENEDFENRASWGKTVLPGAIDADGAGHGTMVAGIIGGKMYGVAKKSRIVAVKVRFSFFFLSFLPTFLLSPSSS